MDRKINNGWSALVLLLIALIIIDISLSLPFVSAFSGSSANYQLTANLGLGMIEEHTSTNYGIEGIMVNQPIGEHTSTNYQLSLGPYSKYFITGDIKYDCKVDIFDLISVAMIFGSGEGEHGYSGLVDLNNDGKINIFDIVLVALNFGNTC